MRVHRTICAMMRNSLLLSVLALLPACSAYAGQEDSTDSRDNPVAGADELITPAAISGGIAFLADDLLEVRGVAARGGRLARRYLQTQMQMMGLEPGGVDGSWEQPVPMALACGGSVGR